MRYDRHLTLPEIGPEGQKRLGNASVLLVGAGGLGSAVGLYLAATGVGRLGVVDFDRVEETNLHRQVIYATPDVGRLKLEVVRERLTGLNPDVAVQIHETKLTTENAEEIIRAYDVVVDGTDNYPTRYLINDTCVLLQKPLVHGAVSRFEGQVSVFDAQRGPCYRCLYPEPPSEPRQNVVFGIVPGVIGTIQATEAVKLILGRGEPLIGRLLLYDALHMGFSEVRFRKDPKCPTCVPR